MGSAGGGGFGMQCLLGVVRYDVSLIESSVLGKCSAERLPRGLDSYDPSPPRKAESFGCGGTVRVYCTLTVRPKNVPGCPPGTPRALRSSLGVGRSFLRGVQHPVENPESEATCT
jgi:hypothetical protein